MSFRTGMYLAAGGVAAALALSSMPYRRPPQARADPTVVVSMINNKYRPASLTVTAGTTVVWENDEDPNATDVTHDVISDDNVTLFSDYISPGGTYTVTLSVPGTYHYFCDLHDGMEATITVQ